MERMPHAHRAHLPIQLLFQESNPRCAMSTLPTSLQGSLDDTEANVLVLVTSETPDMARAMTHTILSHLAEPQTQAQHQHQGQQEPTEHPSTCGQGILLQVAAYAEHVHVSRVPHGCCPYQGI
ncbi:Glutathione hydrolase 6 [Saguinus oedipus]|uniref:Glutathione hydrolase 6 n=2 Tax=Saguinus oedipus TaxID=9490 RepID=A0ABQ9TH51_SAGOE|nr:Glutathione hydrolase 6 [Saguinus oedipus]KAK2105071.1 Glutathione hydrolase 6 [Saguinus oedipus]